MYEKRCLYSAYENITIYIMEIVVKVTQKGFHEFRFLNSAAADFLLFRGTIFFRVCLFPIFIAAMIPPAKF